MIIILMGVAGSGKTTVGVAMARELGWDFVDSDLLHPAGNISRMRDGQALDDIDRAPWLIRIRRLTDGLLEQGRSSIIACSALKRIYRTAINPDPDRVRFVYLKGPLAVLQVRLEKRAGHFFNSKLLPSQFEALEEPGESEAVIVDADQPVDEIVKVIRHELNLETPAV